MKKEAFCHHQDPVRYTELPSELEEIRLGVWSVIKERKQSLKIPDWESSIAWSKATIASMKSMVPFVQDIYAVVGPTMFWTYLVSHLWTGIEPAIFLYLSGTLLSKVSDHATPSAPSSFKIFLYRSRIISLPEHQTRGL